MKHLIKAALFFLLPLQLLGQINLSGTVMDVITDKPIAFASVYIEGTTTGTISDSAGFYTLNKVSYPCQIIVGHTSYFSKSIDVDRNNPPDSIIFLTPKDIGVDEIFVKNKNLREENLKLFNEKFLGNDKWGRQAKIENEDVLKFEWEYDIVLIGPEDMGRIKTLRFNKINIQEIEDSTANLYRVPRCFKAYSSEPLIVTLPLTGYKLRYDLVEFIMEYNEKLDFVYWKYLGYSFYQPIEPKSTSELFRYKRNRLNVYYNSPMHLMRSAYSNKLKQNGYAVVERIQGSPETYEPLNTDDWVYKNNTVEITGNKDREFYVMYYTNINGEPFNLEKREGTAPIQSKIYFMSDTCIIRENGTVANNSILFCPEIGSKQIGASLPSDFKPGPGKL